MAGRESLKKTSSEEKYYEELLSRCAIHDLTCHEEMLMADTSRTRHSQKLLKLPEGARTCRRPTIRLRMRQCMYD